MDVPPGDGMSYERGTLPADVPTKQLCRGQEPAFPLGFSLPFYTRCPSRLPAAGSLRSAGHGRRRASVRRSAGRGHTVSEQVCLRAVLLLITLDDVYLAWGDASVEPNPALARPAQCRLLSGVGTGTR